MDWDFEDFLQKAEGKNEDAKIIPLEKNKPSFPKWFWMAAGLVLIFSIGFLFNQNQETDVNNQAKLVQDEVLKQKNDFINENHELQNQVAVNHTDSISGAKKDSIFEDNAVAEKDVLDEILPKRGRLKKETKPRFVDNSSYTKAENDSTGYKDSYVIVNGKRIDNVEEAINVTKYSFQILANNVSETLAQPKVMNDDY
ncbi:hypothetical protein CHRYSEOSP005_21540 [Chryseobacterium sp. Alg-005]